jgi:exopolysaccharide biosynthesis polyprenyl glycosylphosphotransferase
MPVAAGRRLGAEPASFLVLIDLLALVAAFGLAYVTAPALKTLLLDEATVFRKWVVLLSPKAGYAASPIGDVAWVLLVMAPVTILIFQSTGGYRPIVRQSRTRIVLTAIAAPLVSLSTITLVLFALHDPSWSRLFIFLFTSVSIVHLAGYRLLLRWYRARRITSGFYARHVVLIGPSQTLGRLSAHVAHSISPAEYDVIGYLSVAAVQQPISYSVDGADPRVLPCLGDVGHLSTLLVHRPVHEIIAVHGGGSEWLRDVIETCNYFRITLRLVPETLVFGELSDLQLIYHSDELRLPEIVLRPRHVDSSALFVKRLIDIVVSAILLILLLPLFVVIALLIKLTTPRLSILYRWRVVGYNGQPFTGYKFTTMVEDAEERQTQLASHNEMQGPVFKIRRDPRVTTLGRWLRKFSINELPQLWSVLKGDMSLVGPRPAFPHELERYELWHKRKLSVRPGITCLWQVRGRNQISRFDDWVRMDLEYIDKWSLWLDFKILVRTVWTVVAGTGS